MITADPADAGRRVGGSGVWAAAGTYLLLAIFATWPLARGLASDVASDLGDPLLNIWILSWDCEQFKAILGGDFARLRHFFDANIFYPAPLTLAYSEHLVPQALQIFPIYLATRNPILCYNLLFLSTYVLSGAGAYLLVRELTGNWRAAFLGGLLFAFAPYRIPQASHLQVLSSQWMPFALYGFTRYFNTRRRRALAGAALALAVQGLSCGYYLLYFTPFAAAYVLWEVGRRHLWRDRRLWVELTIAAVVTLLVTAPFLVAYASAQNAARLERKIAEVSGYSADVYSYLTAAGVQRVWGGVVNAYPKPEGELFPGAVPAALGLAAWAMWWGRAWRAGRGRGGGVVGMLLGMSAAVYVILIVVVVLLRRINFDYVPGLPTIRVYSISWLALWLSAFVGLLLAISARARQRFRALGTPEGFFCLLIVGAWWLSLGPTPRVLGRVLEMPAPYGFLYNVVPGFEGVRVPARYAMVVAFGLSIAGALALAPLLRRRGGLAILAVVSIVFFAEAHGQTFSVNGMGSTQGYALPEPRVEPPRRAPAIYRDVAKLPRDIALLELPVGDSNWDLRSVYYSTAHWRKVVNGYSGFFPPGYGLLVLALTDPSRSSDLSWQVVRAAGVTHVIVHERAFRPPEVEQMERWLRSHGAREMLRDGSDVLFALQR
jgi:hypothetical protein